MKSVLERWVGVHAQLGIIGDSQPYTGRLVAVGDDGIIWQHSGSPEQTEELPTRRFYTWSVVRDVRPLESDSDPS